MASSSIFPLMLVIVQFVLVSHAFGDANPSFTIMNYLPKESFVNMNCDCLDVGGSVTTLSDTIGDCVDKEFPAGTCPNGADATAFFCNFKYYVRTGNPATITPYYLNAQLWTSTGPAKTYYQVVSTGFYGSTQYLPFDPMSTTVNQQNLINSWSNRLYQNYNVLVLKDTSVGNGLSF